MADYVKDQIERADELWLDGESRSDEDKAKAFDLLLMDFFVIVGMLKVYHKITQDADNG